LFRHHSEEATVNSYERWNMYYEVQSLKQLGLKVSQIARKLGIYKRYNKSEPKLKETPGKK
jgi:hypothetical protein